MLRITFKQEPKIAYDQEPSLVRNGTLVAVKWPNSARSDLEEAKEQFLQIAEDYTWINPHLSLDVDWTAAEEDPNELHFESIEPEWRKWLPSDPTSAHWYDTDRLERLAGAYVAKDQDRQEMRTVRDFISEFRGMSGSAKQKAVMDATDMSRKPLSDLFPDSNADRNAFDNLLSRIAQAPQIRSGRRISASSAKITSLLRTWTLPKTIPNTRRSRNRSSTSVS